MKEIERCKILIEAMPAVAWITNRDRSDYYISPSVSSVLGYSQVEILSQGEDFWKSHIHEADLKKAIAAVNDLFVQKNAYAIHFRVRHRLGHWVWVRDKVVSYTTEKDDEFAIGMLFDVTEQREAENRLIESQKRFFDLAENSTDWFWEFDENTVFTYSSPGVYRILGYTPEEVIGKNAFDFIPSPEKEKVAREFAESKNVHAPFSNLENINRHKNGHMVSIESSGSPIFDAEGRFRGYRGIDRDITSRKQMEAQLLHAQKMDAMGILAGGIAHDFNNILAGIMGFADLLELSISKEEHAFHYITGIQKASERARQLVQQILTFGKKTESTQTQVIVEDMIDETISFMRATLPATIHINKENCVDDSTFVTDSAKLQQVLINLCTNAAHAIGKSHGRITLSVDFVSLDEKKSALSSDIRTGMYLKLTVADTGCGISEVVLPKIFDPYFSTKEKGKGTGLGLSVVHGIVTQQNGFITVDSEEGKGTQFHIYLPKKTEISSRESIEDIEEFPGSGEHILFVDDEPLLTQVQQLSLEAMGYRVTATTSSVDALNRFKQQPQLFDMLIADYTMPNLTGEELADAVVSIQPDTPVIICSGYCESVFERVVQKNGARSYLMKPVERNVLAKTIYEYFHKNK
ncbi:MAG: PAS domain S-box protein [Deltaproteobacteria bacterium]|nr:PAS domain S-box protein [Deltaproteobacteria bacterium]MBN2670439.1 PAS domain S-box protein [Deltaproteobacteria bacterium]